jgi:hypothetical protein
VATGNEDSTVDVQCPAGAKPLSGGASPTTDTNAVWDPVIELSAPADAAGNPVDQPADVATGWVARIDAPSGQTTTFRVHVVCATP